MIIHPQLRALRGDDSPQRIAQDRMQAALAEWRTRLEVMDTMADLAAFAAGRPFDACAALVRLFTPGDEFAQQLVGDFVRIHALALREAPLGHPALRHFTDGVLSTLQLGRSGMVTLTLVSVDGQAFALRPAAPSIGFSPVETWQTVLAGAARAELVERRPCGSRDDRPVRSALQLSPGQVHYRWGMEQELQLLEVAGRLVTLRLQRRHPDAGPAVEIDLASGKQLHQAAGNPADSRLELMMALLGRMGRSEAAPTMAQIAGGNAGAALRWQALRECLALDTAAGFAALDGLAERSGDALNAPAAALRSQLLEAHPQLEQIVPCRA